jgi:glycosyltransferase involved in cell wall biosynthesis
VNPTPSRERICLLTGGGYPYRRDALGGWCRTLVDGLHRFRFELLTVTDRELPSAPAYPLPLNVGSARAIALSRKPARFERRRAHLPDSASDAVAQFCHGLLDESATDVFADGLRGIAEMAGNRPSPLPRLPLAEKLLDAWRWGLHPEPDNFPKLSVRDARIAAALLRHALRALAVPVPEVDLVHCVGGTTPLLTALAGRWRSGTPLLLTEGRTPVTRRRPGEERLSPAVRLVLRRFRSAVARTGYAEAEIIAPLSGYHHGWALEHGAAPTRLVRVPAGVDPKEYPGAAETDNPPSVVWAGSGGPDSGLTPMLDAFAEITAALPGTVLHLVGVTAKHEEYCADRIEQTGQAGAIRMNPLPSDPRERFTVGQVVAHVPGPSDPPSRLIEAMMSGRPVVALDVGPAAETLGDTGVVVPADDPSELAIAIVDLLRAAPRRRALGDAARQRALNHFTADRVVRVYGALYTDLAAPPPARAFELALAVPAPRTPMPATVRWLTRED